MSTFRIKSSDGESKVVMMESLSSCRACSSGRLRPYSLRHQLHSIASRQCCRFVLIHYHQYRWNWRHFSMETGRLDNMDQTKAADITSRFFGISTALVGTPDDLSGVGSDRQHLQQMTSMKYRRVVPQDASCRSTKSEFMCGIHFCITHGLPTLHQTSLYSAIHTGASTRT